MSWSNPKSYGFKVRQLSSLIKHPGLPTTAMIAVGGICLMVANLIYARLLEPEDFGYLILVETAAFVIMGLLPFGFDSLIIRKEFVLPLPRPKIALLVSLAVCATLISVVHYNLGNKLALAIYALGAGVSGAAMRLFASVEQSQLRFARAQTISQLALVLFLGGAVFHLFFGLHSWQNAGITFVLSNVVGALFGNMLVRASDRPLHQAVPARKLLSRALPLFGIYASLLLLNQMERLIAAGVLDMRELGTLGLATTLVASPFRLLSTGVGYTLMPRLTTCNNKRERQRLLLEEFVIAMGVGISGTILLMLFVPSLVATFFGNKYDISFGLVIALCILGLTRLNSGVFATAINALGSTKTLHLFNTAGWTSVAIGAGAAIALSNYGSTGIVVGATIGWATRILCAVLLVRKEL